MELLRDDVISPVLGPMERKLYSLLGVFMLTCVGRKKKCYYLRFKGKKQHL